MIKGIQHIWFVKQLVDMYQNCLFQYLQPSYDFVGISHYNTVRHSNVKLYIKLTSLTV